LEFSPATNVPPLKLGPATNVPPSRVRAIATLVDEHPGTLRLFVGEDTLPTPDFIKEAGKMAIVENKTYYTPSAGYLEVRKAVADRIADLHGIDVDPASQVVVTSGGMTAIVLAVQATTGPGDSAIVLTPFWPNLTGAIRVAGAEVIEVPLSFAPEGYRLDFDHLEAAVRPNTRLIALASPGNPTGWTASLDDWRKIVEFCERHALWLMADGAYERIVFNGKVAPSPLSIAEARPRTIIAQTLSKAYRMTGWRIGYAVGPPELGRAMTYLNEYVVSNASGINQEAARVALRDGEEFIAESVKRYAHHQRLVVERMSGMEGIELPKPGGAFYVFPRLRGLIDSYGFCERLVRERGVGFAPGAAFGAGGEGHIRICFAVDETTLIEALDRFEAGWSEFRAREALS
jgi:aspartate/methionine/tyrosine aminotransferase